ncbi:probable choline transport protein [Rhynchosporium agropyri]|uniref:Probable choline transport protein n=1 Tax=Rhynchosporium agropyri TaxID=914238 RepID=A0A1E1KGL9_9HELO|nr:probable choline transport protein [Rhynchosporium agropyri]
MEHEKQEGIVSSAKASDRASPPPSPEHSREILINPSGHKQELERNFSLLSLCAVAITTGNTWVAIGGSVIVAIYNGGPPGVLYEFIAVSVCYWLIAASIAELASAMPSSSGVYHWASVTAGRYGRPVGYFAGWWNFLAWVFGAGSISSILANQTASMYAMFHPDFISKPWHTFVSYVVCTWLCCFIVLFGNRSLPLVGNIGGFLIIAGVFTCIVVCATMPTVNGVGHASNDFVWKEWRNLAGYSDGFTFVAGMLNGAFAVGTPDCVSHLAEEIPNPSRNIPKAMLFQYAIGFITAFTYLISLFYSIQDLDAIFKQASIFPLAYIYRQATGTNAGAVGLLLVTFLPTFVTCVGCYITAGRTFWTLSRDNATPFAPFFAQISPSFHNPFNATVLCGVICTVMGCIYVGSTVAFAAFVGSFIILSTLSYLCAIVPHLLGGRKLQPGYFWMHGAIGYIVNAISCIYMLAFIVIFCFPSSSPFSIAVMNWSSLIVGGMTLFVAGFWFWRQSDYEGPKLVSLDEAALAKDAA